MANRSRKPSRDLPGSDKKDFWGEDTEKFAIERKAPELIKKHTFIQKGHAAICASCPFTHAVYLGRDQEVRNGQIVKKT